MPAPGFNAPCAIAGTKVSKLFLRAFCGDNAWEGDGFAGLAPGCSGLDAEVWRRFHVVSLRLRLGDVGHGSAVGAADPSLLFRPRAGGGRVW